MMHALRPAPYLAAATAGGWVAAMFGIPLAWLIGAAIVSTAISLTIGTFAVPAPLYRAGQLVVGVSVGLTVTAEVTARIGPHLPLVVLAAAVSIGIGRVAAPLLARAGGIDRRTAYFSLVPAGISEMADLAQRRGADAGCVATMHAARVFLVVLVLPPLIYQIGEPALLEVRAGAGAFTPGLAAALAVGIVAAFVGSAAGMPSAWIVAPMLCLAVLSGGGLIEAKEPAPMLAAAQVMLGLSLGTRFQRERILRLPRALAVGAGILALNGTAMAAAALAISHALGFDLPLMLLAFAIGGTAEMVLTARVVGADAALVAVYQVTRGLLGNVMAAPVYDWTMRGSADDEEPRNGAGKDG
jgi:uncharacterized protein